MRPAKAGAFSGRQSHRGKSRSPVAWVAGLQWGNRDSEAYRQRHRKDGGESPGRSASEREVASKLWPRRPSWQWLRRRQHGSSRTDRSDGTLRRGGYRRHGGKDVLSNWRDGAAVKAANLGRWKSSLRQLPGFGRKAYPLQGEVTSPDRRGRKSHGRLASQDARVGAIGVASKLVGLNISE